jgi:hypothetical protein
LGKIVSLLILGQRWVEKESYVFGVFSSNQRSAPIGGEAKDVLS